MIRLAHLTQRESSQLLNCDDDDDDDDSDDDGENGGEEHLKDVIQQLQLMGEVGFLIIIFLSIPFFLFMIIS